MSKKEKFMAGLMWNCRRFTVGIAYATLFQRMRRVAREAWTYLLQAIGHTFCVLIAIIAFWAYAFLIPVLWFAHFTVSPIVCMFKDDEWFVKRDKMYEQLQRQERRNNRRSC